MTLHVPLIIRPATSADLPRVRDFAATPSINTTTLAVLDRNLAIGSYRPEWMWVAEDGDEIRAVAVWWGPPEWTRPVALDGLFCHPFVDDCTATWTDLLAPTIRDLPPDAERPEYHIFLPPDWRGDDEITTALKGRLEAAANVGLTDLTERWRYQWESDQAVPPRSSRLTCAPEPDDEVFVDLFARVAVGSLDAATARDVARGGVERAARADLAIYRSMPGERGWWRIARDAEGQVVGFAIPSANDGGPVVGYLGVLPEHRGHGYVDDLLAEVTAILHESGADRIRADTDVGNTPMAAAFERAGYAVFAVRLVASEPPT
ncbi:MAG: GNAT family N-acetyltransferase [Lapillicoccus sp.]